MLANEGCHRRKLDRVSIRQKFSLACSVDFRAICIQAICIHGGLLTLLDDIATILDDVSILTKKAAANMVGGL